MDDLGPRHGTPRGYHAGCRESCCLGAAARYEKGRRLDALRGGRAVPALGAQRRIQALVALGWTQAHIAKVSGLYGSKAVYTILKGQKGKPCVWVQRDTHARVVKAYDLLSMRLPPAGDPATRARARAARNGWAPPLAWDEGTIDDPTARPHVARPADLRRPRDFIDPVAVARVLSGDANVATSKAEKVEICRQWVESGRRLAELEALTGWRANTYYRLSDEQAVA